MLTSQPVPMVLSRGSANSAAMKAVRPRQAELYA
jgi:hypothetical protein